MAEEKKGMKKVGILVLAAALVVGGACAFKSCNKKDNPENQNAQTKVDPKANPETPTDPKANPETPTPAPTDSTATPAAPTPAPEAPTAPAEQPQG